MRREALHREDVHRKCVRRSAIDPSRAQIGALGVAASLLAGICVLALQAAASSAIAGKLPPSNISEPDFSRSGYGFLQFRFSAGGRTDFYGHGQSGAVIIVTMADRVIGQGAVDAKGKWHLSMAPAKPVWQARQEVHLQLLAFEPQEGRTGTMVGNDLQMVDDVRLTVPSHVPSLAAPRQSRAKSRLAVQSNTQPQPGTGRRPSTQRQLAAYPPLPTRRARAAVAAGAIYGRTASSSSDQVSAAGKVQPAKQPVAAQISPELSNHGGALELEQAGSVLKRASSMIVTAFTTYGQVATDLSAPREDRSFIPKNVQFAAGQSSDGSAGAASQRSQTSQLKDQINPPRAPIILAQVTGASGGDVMDTLQKWYKQSEADYRDVIRKLAKGGAQKGEQRRQADRGADASKRGNEGERRTTSGLQRLLESVLPSDWWKRMRDGTRVAEEKSAKERAGEGNGSAGPLSLKGAETAAKDEGKARETRAKELALAKQRDELAAARTERERRQQQQRLQKQRQGQQRQDQKRQNQQRLADAARLAKKEAALEKAAAVARAAAQGAQQRKEKAAELARLKQEQLKEDQLKEERRRQLAAAAQDAKEQTAKARALEEAQAEAAAQKTRENLKAERAAERARMLAQRQAKERRARAELNRRVAEQKREFAAQQKAAALKIARAKAAEEQAARENAAKEQAVREKELALEQARIESQRQARLEAEKDATADAKARELAAQRRKDEAASRQADAAADAAQAQAQAQAQADAAAKTKRQSTIAAAALAAKQAVDQKRKPAGQSANEGEKPAANESLGSKVKRKFAFSIKEAKEAAAAALGAARAKIAKENRQKTREQRLALSLPTRRQVDQGSRAGSDDGGRVKVGDNSAAGANSKGRRQTAEQVEPPRSQRSQRLAQKSTARKNTALDAAAASDRGANMPKDKRSCKNAGLQIDLPGWYVVRRGDTLRTIASQHYRSSRARRLIYRANEDRIDDLKNLQPCTRMRLPLPEPAG